jgi:uncharacterized protein (TIGR00251 family)
MRERLWRLDESWYQWDGYDLLITVYVQPRASRDAIAGLHDGALKICITAPPAHGKANQYLGKFLAKLFGVARSRVTLLSGDSNRRKRFKIQAPRHSPQSITMS